MSWSTPIKRRRYSRERNEELWLNLLCIDCKGDNDTNRNEISDARALLRVAAAAFVESGDVDKGNDDALRAAARALVAAEERWMRRAEEMARREENR